MMAAALPKQSIYQPAAFVDTNVLIHLLRGNSSAIAWLQTQLEPLAVTPYTWMEVVYGAVGKQSQAVALALLAQFEMVYPSHADMDWAMDMLRKHRQNYGVDVLDCLIAATCSRLGAPLYSHNLRHMMPLLGAEFVVKPYEL